jgi:hypothetical protein
MKIDHVTIAGPDLEPMRAAFARVGLETAYGGLHSNSVTHMALLGFEDGSYVELISTVDAGAESPIWPAHIAGNGGPCAWAIDVEDLTGEQARLAALGIPARGPIPLSRRRADGRLVDWELVYVGEGQPGATLPFLIHDRTPRGWRVAPTASAGRAGLTGVARVVLGVEDLAGAVTLVREALRLGEPSTWEDEGLGATLAFFRESPVVLATAAAGWLRERLDRYGPSPCAFLLRARDLGETSARLGLSRVTAWLGKPAAWLDPAALNGTRLGVI